MTDANRRPDAPDITQTAAIELLGDLARIGIDVLALKARGVAQTQDRPAESTASEQLEEANDELFTSSSPQAVSEHVTAATKRPSDVVPSEESIRMQLGLPVHRVAPVFRPHPNTIRSRTHHVCELLSNKKVWLGLGIGTLVLGVGAGTAAAFGVFAKDGNEPQVARSGQAENATDGQRTAPAGGVNLATSLSAADLISKKPFAILGYQGTGEMQIIYTGKDKKKHTIDEYKGDKLNWSLSQAVKYYSHPADLNRSPLSFEQKDGRTTIKVDLSKMAFDIDPTMKNGVVGEDGTMQNFVLPLYPKGSQVVTSEEVDGLEAVIINGLITESSNVDAAAANISTPEEWKNLPESQQVVTAGRPTAFLVAQAALLGRFETGECGDAGVLNDAEKTVITEQLQAALKNLGVDTSTIDTEFSGATKNDALERIANSEKYGATYKAIDKVSSNLMKPVNISATCTVTQANAQG